MKTTMLDIIEKMAKGEDIPRKIKIDDNILEWDSLMFDYQDEDGDWLFEDYAVNESLNDEVEILETTVKFEPISDMISFSTSFTIEHILKANKIEKLVKHGMTKNQKKIADKINEIIDHINED